MTESDIFLENLRKAVEESRVPEAQLSLAAGLNRRAVTDLLEGRVQSPKLSTVFALSHALKRDPGEMMGLGRRHQIIDALAEFLRQYDEADQERFLSALAALSSVTR